MSKPKCTSGPWKATLSDSMVDDEDAWIVTSDDEDVAEVTSCAATAEVNARLIAAAPTLLAELREARDTIVTLYRRLPPNALDASVRNQVDRIDRLLTEVPS